MGRNYDGIKQRLKINETFESSGTEEESAIAVKALRP